MNEEQFIQHDFKLPDYTTELSKAEDVIEKLKTKLKKTQQNKSITGDIHTEMYEETIRVLDYVGRLSVPVFEIEDEMERMYVLQFPKFPELAKKIWLEHYDSLHHPYSILKSRCYRILEELDCIYRKKFKANPPNWNI